MLCDRRQGAWVCVCLCVWVSAVCMWLCVCMCVCVPDRDSRCEREQQRQKQNRKTGTEQSDRGQRDRGIRDRTKAKGRESAYGETVRHTNTHKTETKQRKEQVKTKKRVLPKPLAVRVVVALRSAKLRATKRPKHRNQGKDHHQHRQHQGSRARVFAGTCQHQCARCVCNCPPDSARLCVACVACVACAECVESQGSHPVCHNSLEIVVVEVCAAQGSERKPSAVAVDTGCIVGHKPLAVLVLVLRLALVLLPMISLIVARSPQAHQSWTQAPACQHQHQHRRPIEAQQKGGRVLSQARWPLQKG